MENPSERPKPDKPLGHKAYGSIPHLPGSRRGPGDYGLSDKQAAILTTKARDKHDLIIVQEKLDGSCVSVAKINNEIVPLIRAGYPAKGSNYKQHHLFHDWVMKKENLGRFAHLLVDGERVCGEWLAQAHGTRYELWQGCSPFVVFDIIIGHERKTVKEVFQRCSHLYINFDMPWTIHAGDPISIEDALSKLGEFGHYGAMDPVEGAVWRVERKGVFDFMGKYVRPEKGPDGKYLESVTGKDPVWNWKPE